MLNDPVSNALSHINTAEIIGKSDCTIRPVSKVIRKILDILNQNMYIGSFEELPDSKGNSIKVNLLKRINKCGSIKPRYSIKINNIEQWEKRYLPSKDFGIIILSTSKGIMTHYDAKKKRLGGKLICYCY
jgi:small subunit ribosomal protein S8